MNRKFMKITIISDQEVMKSYVRKSEVNMVSVYKGGTYVLLKGMEEASLVSESATDLLDQLEESDV